jgi:hypothetical protein
MLLFLEMDRKYSLTLMDQTYYNSFYDTAQRNCYDLILLVKYVYILGKT